MRRSYSTQEKVDLVEEYMFVRNGHKQAWCEARGLTVHRVNSWRRAYLYGDLAKGLVPRDASQMSIRDGARYHEVLRALRAEEDSHKHDVETLQARIDQLEASNAALGKAIGLLHDLSEPKQEPHTPSEPEAGPAPQNSPQGNDSSRD